MLRYVPLPMVLTVLATAPLQADPAKCLLVHSTVPAGSYSGSAALPGGPGGVLDRCRRFPGWQLSNAGPAGTIPSETIFWNAPVEDFGFWVGARMQLSLRFFLGDEEQHDTGWITVRPRRQAWWQWEGTYDRVEVNGVHVLMLYGLDLVPDDVVDPLLEPPVEPHQTALDEAVAGTVGDGPRFDDSIAATVPEPATLTLLASGLVGLAGAARRRREAAKL